MKVFKPYSVHFYGNNAVIHVDNNLDEEYDYLVLDTRGLSVKRDYYVLKDVTVKDSIVSDIANRIGLNYGESIKMDDEPTKKNVIKALI